MGQDDAIGVRKVETSDHGPRTYRGPKYKEIVLAVERNIPDLGEGYVKVLLPEGLTRKEVKAARDALHYQTKKGYWDFAVDASTEYVEGEGWWLYARKKEEET